MKVPFTAVGFAEPCCIARTDLELSPGGEKLRAYLAHGLVGSCAGGATRYSFHWNGLTVYVCERHGAQRVAQAKRAK